MSSSSRNPSRSNQLGKGAACLNCRHRKIRCDGAQPVCGQCSRSDVFVDCEYSGSSANSRTRALEERIASVQQRINVLESGPSVPSVTEAPLLMQALGFSSLPPVHQDLVTRFLTFGPNIGFFLNPTIFSADFASAVIPSLHSCTLLWGIHLSGNPQLTAEEPMYLSSAAENASQDRARNVGHTRGLLQCIQLEVLLANYLLRSDKLVEGRYHVSQAVSLVLSSGMHKYRPEGRDIVREGERLNAIWNVLALEASWSAFDDSVMSFDPNAEQSRIDAPWPLDTVHYQEITNLPPRNASTIQKFLAGEPDNNMSMLSLFAKATLLFSKSTTLSPSDILGTKAVVGVLDTFIQPLPAPNTLPNPSLGVVIHSLAYASVIALYKPASPLALQHRPRAIKAARSMIRLLNVRITFLDAILGIAWVKTCKFLVGEIGEAPHGEAFQLLGQLVGAMRSAAPRCAFIGSQLKVVEAHTRHLRL
ncbi:hypothetical protein CYLTODRAFT_492179 [Cylindrobasidium torrendii FP15055 ss-10]|uniref:Zn(2)-C6 fungal-type domain-containing protein n=1 Tax=Cylindrobasidium torrendii FP15055 ss-10 TaxID=1314674 RepID=A0A0D7B607_9AGAR|nr:hypothetical protein CYLTODRAFT_492179 [Cylindrobasidium torrendii FP15055 ss-10]